MYTSKNTIKQSEISITPVKVKYAATYSREDTDVLDIDGIQYPIFANTNIIWRFAGNTSNESIFYQSNSAPRLNGINYRLIKQLYYQNYFTGSLLNSASYWDESMQSTACSGSAEYEYRYLPTSSTNSTVNFAYVPPEYAGEQISKNTFCLKPQNGNSYKIIDDGNGNLIDIENSNTHVGNIIYSQGMIIITNNNYLGTFTDA